MLNVMWFYFGELAKTLKKNEQNGVFFLFDFYKGADQIFQQAHNSKLVKLWKTSKVVAGQNFDPQVLRSETRYR
jgi:hypothetical protein